ncbi:hypothetical protein PTE30175_05605 [Pandoraea terrae]|uniref:Uncharacterized protein n=1 Tax=Pandoraea terrae TaxID=1537710 RepID=A0A5E4ZGC5_9BURK|nr:hypothetical protein PTE30175_05605 [Pandoraea terrae]
MRSMMDACKAAYHRARHGWRQGVKAVRDRSLLMAHAYRT